MAFFAYVVFYSTLFKCNTKITKFQEHNRKVCEINYASISVVPKTMVIIAAITILVWHVANHWLGTSMIALQFHGVGRQPAVRPLRKQKPNLNHETLSAREHEVLMASVRLTIRRQFL